MPVELPGSAKPVENIDNAVAQTESDLPPTVPIDTPPETPDLLEETKMMTPEEGSANIEGGKKYDIAPDLYNEVKEHLSGPEIMEDTPVGTPEYITTRMVASSKSIQAVTRADIPNLTLATKLFGSAIGAKEMVQIRRAKNAIIDIRFLGGKLNPDQFMELARLNELEGQVMTTESLGLNIVEGTPGVIAGSFFEMAMDIIEASPLMKVIGVAGLAGGVLLSAFVAAPSAVIGTLLGLATASPLLKGAYFQASRDVYGDLENSKLVQGLGEVESQEMRVRIATGAGVLMAGFRLLPFGVMKKIVGKVPFIRPLLGSKELILAISKPSGKPLLDAIMSLGLMGLAEGTEEGFQEFTQIVAKALADTYAKNKDGLDFMTAFGEGFSPENLDRIRKSFKIGALAGAGTGAAVSATKTAVKAAITRVVKDRAVKLEKITVKPERGEGPTTIRAIPTPPPEAEVGPTDAQPLPTAPPISDIVGGDKDLTRYEKTIKASELSTALKISSALLREGSLKKYAPDELRDIRQEMFDEKGLSFVFISKEKLNSISTNDPDLIKAIETLISEQDIHAADINVELQIPTGRLMDLIDQEPSVADIVSAEPGGITASEINDVDLDNMDDTKDLSNETPYLDEKASPEVQEARKSVVEALSEEQDTGVLIGPKELITQQKEADQIQQVLEEPNKVRRVEEFINNENIITELTPEQEKRLAKNLPVYSIDPKTLTSEQTVKFADNARLKKRKVFVKDGVPAAETAALFGIGPGIQSVDDFLTILSTTPTVQEIQNASTKRGKAELRESLKEHTRLAKAYDKLTEELIKDIDKIRERQAKLDLKSSTSLETGTPKEKLLRRKNAIVRLPKLEDFQDSAKDITDNTPINRLNVNKFKVAERKSNRLSDEADSRGDTDQAIKEKVNAAKNVQLSRRAHLAVGQLNAAFKFLSKLDKPGVRAQLKRAGKNYENAVNALLKLFDFTDTKDVTSATSQYRKYADQMANEGKGDHRIKPEIADWLKSARDIEDMTVTQIVHITDLIKGVLHQASLKSQVLAEVIDKGLDPESPDRIVNNLDTQSDTLHDRAIIHDSWNLDRGDATQGLTPVKDFISTADESLSNLSAKTQGLDGNKIGGPFSELVYQPIRGSAEGSFEAERGDIAKVAMVAKFRKKFKVNVRKYGRIAFANLTAELVDIKEFRKVKALNNGKLTKMDIVMLVANMGNPSNQKSLLNYGEGLTIETLWKVVKRELDRKDFDFVQEALWDPYIELKPKLNQLELDTTGIELEFTVPGSFEAHGKTYSGGHFPLRYLKDVEYDAMSKQEEIDTSDGPVFPNDVLSGLTMRSHSKDRIGSKWKIDLNPGLITQGMDAVIHDLTMRVPIRDVMSLLNHEQTARDIVAISGKEGLTSLKELIQIFTNEPGDRNARIHRAIGSKAGAAARSIDASFAVSHLLFNLKTVGMTALSIPMIYQKMGGLRANFYLGLGVMHLANPLNWKKTNGYIRLVQEIDPSLKSYAMDLNESSISVARGVTPVHRRLPRIAGTTARKTWNLARMSSDITVEQGFKMTLGTADAIVKSGAILAVYFQYKKGHAKDGPNMKQLALMTQAQIETKARAHAEQFVGSVTQRSGQIDRNNLQHHKVGQFITRFYSDVRNYYDMQKQDLITTKVNIKEAVRAVKRGDLGDAARFTMSASIVVTNQVVATLFMLAIMNGVKTGDFLDIDDDEGEEDLDFRDDITIDRALRFGKHHLTTVRGVKDLVVVGALSTVPIAREVTFGAESGRPVSIPILSAIQTGTKAIATVPKLYQHWEDGLTTLEMFNELTEFEQLLWINTASYTPAGAMPAAAYKALNKVMADEDGFWDMDNVTIPIREATNNMISSFKSFVRKFEKTDEEKLQAIIDSDELSVMDRAIIEIKSIISKLDPTAQVYKISNDDLNVMLFTESNNVWDARPYKRDSKGKLVLDSKGRKQPVGTAFGLYQFTALTWRRIMDDPGAVHLGLTIADRTVNDPELQHRVARWLSNDNAKVMIRNQVVVSIDSLYFAWHFGPANAALVFNSPSKTKIKRVLTPRVLENNPKLKRLKVKTAGDMRRYISRQLNLGRKLKAKSN